MFLATVSGLGSEYQQKCSNPTVLGLHIVYLAKRVYGQIKPNNLYTQRGHRFNFLMGQVLAVIKAQSQ